MYGESGRGKENTQMFALKEGRFRGYVCWMPHKMPIRKAQRGFGRKLKFTSRKPLVRQKESPVRLIFAISETKVHWASSARPSLL